VQMGPIQVQIKMSGCIYVVSLNRLVFQQENADSAKALVVRNGTLKLDLRLDTQIRA